MIIRIGDIPPEGLTLEFDLPVDELNRRADISPALQRQGASTVAVTFSGKPHAYVNLKLEGSTVVLSGKVLANYQTICSRCAEPAAGSLATKLSLVLRPHSERAALGAEDEDVGVGFYREKLVELKPIAEELLLLDLPYTVLCDENCRGLCAQCGANLNLETCDCVSAPEGDPRLAVLRGLKLH